MTFGNPELAAAYNLDRRNRADSIEETAKLLIPLHASCAEKLQRIATNPDDFADLYSAESIQEDKEYVARRKQEFAAGSYEKMNSHGELTKGEVKKLSEIAEYLIIKGVNVDGWIPYVTMSKTAEADDIGRGVDAVLEFAKGIVVGQAGLSIDVSFSHDLGSKFRKIKSDIDEYDGEKKRLAVVKYHKSKQTGFRGELSGIPRVVIGLDLGVMEDIVRSKDPKNHLAKHIIIAEITEQLRIYRDYAQRVNPACVEAFERALRFMTVVQESLQSKQTLEQSNYMKNRKMSEVFEKNLAMFR